MRSVEAKNGGSEVLWTVLGKGVPVYCARCGKSGGAGILLHVFVHVLDLIVVGIVAAVVSGAMTVKWGWLGTVAGAAMGIGLGAFRERGRGRVPPGAQARDCG